MPKDKVTFQVVKSVTPYENGADPVSAEVSLDSPVPDTEGLQDFMEALARAIEGFMLSHDGRTFMLEAKDKPFTVAVTFGG